LKQVLELIPDQKPKKSDCDCNKVKIIVFGLYDNVKESN